MLFLLFRLGKDWYALDATAAEEVLPLTSLKQIPHAPAGVAGLFSFHGQPVPVIDLNLMAVGRASRTVRSTRIILVHCRDGRGERRLLGLIAERATETMRRQPTEFVDAGVRSDGAPYLGPVVQDERGLVQRITPDKLLTETVRAALFAENATL
jgi:chemotaxis-related protein WspB